MSLPLSLSLSLSHVKSTPELPVQQINDNIGEEHELTPTNALTNMPRSRSRSPTPCSLHSSLAQPASNWNYARLTEPNRERASNLCCSCRCLCLSCGCCCVRLLPSLTCPDRGSDSFFGTAAVVVVKLFMFFFCVCWPKETLLFPLSLPPSLLLNRCLIDELKDAACFNFNFNFSFNLRLFLMLPRLCCCCWTCWKRATRCR